MDEGLKLIRACEEYAGQYEAYRRDFLESGDSMDGTGPLRRIADGRAWLREVARYEDPSTVPEGKVCATQYILVRERDGKLLGMLQLRHELNDYLRLYAGHIGYSVRPSERRRGYAAAMLALGLREARARGLRRVLITCHVSNEASRRTILANGGVYECAVPDPDGGEALERYWIEL